MNPSRVEKPIFRFLLSRNDSVDLGSAPAPGAVRRASRRIFRGARHRTEMFVQYGCRTGGRGVRQNARVRACSLFPTESFRLSFPLSAFRVSSKLAVTHAWTTAR